jgi:hypothetical protein
MSIERFFASPLVARMALTVAVFLSIVLVISVGFAAAKPEPSTSIHPCALTLTRESGPECR